MAIWLYLSLVSLLFTHVCFGLDQRISVIDNPNKNQFLAFQVSTKLQVAISTDSEKWGPWMTVNASKTYPTLISNPVAIFDQHSKGVVVFVQASDGQVYLFSQQTDSTFTVQSLSSTIPINLPSSEFSHDGVKVVSTTTTSMTHLFVRSQSNQSRIYYSYQQWEKGVWSSFVPIGDDKNFLMYDFDVVVNTFVWRVEIYAVMEDQHMKHVWQTSPTSFNNDWHNLVLFPPKFNAAPAAHTMGHSDFNGIVEVFGREGNTLHYIHQTTCDKVKNPWGPCTWELEFHKLSDNLLSDPKSPNPLSVSNNIHLGLEVFIIGMQDGHLYHMWQPERGKDWSDWEDLRGFGSTAKFSSLPCIVLDHHGWWDAYGLSSTSGMVNKLVQTPMDFAATPQKALFNQNVTVTWKIPNDEATHKDWIGVYPAGSNNMKYVDFAYVGGTQNPKSDPVPKGQLKLAAVLPNGNYDYRYLVNKEFDSVLQATVEVYNGTTDVEWVQVYKGIARGLNNLATNLTACVEDGDLTIEAFRESFKAFEDREIFKGLQLFGEALKDVYDTLIQCEETDIAKKLEKFIADLIACTESNCANFAIDIGLEIVILYERIYEIYGDIYAAKNCFDIDAYEMGGICIGRVTWACLALPDVNMY